MQHRQGEGPGVEDDVFEEDVRRLESREAKLVRLAEAGAALRAGANKPEMAEG